MIPADRRRFARALGIILFAALGLRVGYVLTVTRHDQHFYDALYYDAEARAIEEGRGFVDPFAAFEHRPATPTAAHPPLTSIVLVPAAWLSDDTLGMRFEMTLLGVAVVAGIGLLGRALAGDRAGLVAAGIAAVYPNLWMNDGLVMSETLATLLTVAASLLAYRLLRRPSLRLAIALGAVCGLATLTRAELVLYVPLLLVPAFWLTRRDRRRDALAWGGAAVVAAVVVVAPWTAYNLSRFEDATFVSTNDGVALLGSNCRGAYYGRGIGLTSLRCLGSTPTGDESRRSRVYRDRAFDYVGAHLTRVPLVALARVGRLWSVWDPPDTIRFNVGEGRPEWASTLGVVSLFLLLAAAVPGDFVLRRRRAARWPLLVPVLVVSVAAVLFYGQPRFRAPAEPAIVVLAAIAMDAWLRARGSGVAGTLYGCLNDAKTGRSGTT